MPADLSGTEVATAHSTRKARKRQKKKPSSARPAKAARASKKAKKRSLKKRPRAESAGSGARRGTVSRPKRLGGNRFLGLLETVKPEIDARLSGFLDAKMDATKKRGPAVRAVLDALRDLSLRGGKRLRPALVVAGYLGVRETEDWGPALDVGVALELLQAYFLIHDDWMDGDRMRRGGPAVHASLERRFRSSHLGAAGAILAGDYAVALATEVLSRVESNAEQKATVFSIFADMQQDAVIGQQLDVLEENAEVLETYRLKTASYTVQGPLRLGSTLAGARAGLQRKLDQLARYLGVAFQLRDDQLSLFGDPEKTGKPFGSDLKAGKRTLLVELAQKHANEAQGKALAAAWGNPKASRRALTRAIEVLQETGAREMVEKRIGELSGRAEQILAKTPVTELGQSLLQGAILTLTQRQR